MKNVFLFLSLALNITHFTSTIESNFKETIFQITIFFEQEDLSFEDRIDFFRFLVSFRKYSRWPYQARSIY